MDYKLEGVPRPPPLVPGLPQPSIEELEAGLAEAALAETREKLAAFLQETEETKVRACWSDRVAWSRFAAWLLGGRQTRAACPRPHSMPLTTAPRPTCLVLALPPLHP